MKRWLGYAVVFVVAMLLLTKIMDHEYHRRLAADELVVDAATQSLSDALDRAISESNSKPLYREYMKAH